MGPRAATLFTVGGYLSVLAITAMLGCASGPAPHDSYYRFNLPDPPNRMASPALRGTLLVTRPWTDALTGERSLLYRENGDAAQVRRHAYHRWVDSPTTLLQQEIAGYVRAVGLAEIVVTPERRADPDYLLTCRIVKLERVLDSPPRSDIELELGITRMTDRHAVMLKTYREAQPAAGTGVAASVDAYNQALSRVLKHFVEDLSELLDAGDVEQDRKEAERVR